MLNTPLEIYKLLPRTNCGDCGLSTCMAFASAVFAGDKQAAGCPHLGAEASERISTEVRPVPPGEGFTEKIRELKLAVAALDLREVAPRIGAEMGPDGAVIEVLGRRFTVTPRGNLLSTCHANLWMETILLNYCLTRADGSLSGRWVTFAGLEGAAGAAPYFARRCEEPLHAIADAHTDIFMELLEIFGGEKTEGGVVIRPLPRVPYLVRHTPKTEGMDSGLRVMFDSTASAYLGPEVLTYAGRGIVEMFQRIIPKHQELLEKIKYL